MQGASPIGNPGRFTCLLKRVTHAPMHMQVVECVARPLAAVAASTSAAAPAAGDASAQPRPAHQLPAQPPAQRYAAKIIDRGSVKREGG